MSISFRKNRKPRPGLMSDVNVTPMIDVMLVLLIIFMIAAPMMTTGVDVQLPKATAPNVTENEKPTVVNIDVQGRVYIGNTEVEEDTLGIKLKAIVGDLTTRIFVKGDRVLPYGAVMKIMGNISESGFKRVVLVTELPKKRKIQ